MVCFPCCAVPKKNNTPSAKQPPRRLVSHLDSPVFISDSDDDDANTVIKSTLRTRHSKPKAPPKAGKNNAVLSDNDDSSPSLPLPPTPSPFSRPPLKTSTSPASPKRTFSAPSRLDDSASSEEEFTSLLERLKKKNQFTSTTFSPKDTKGDHSACVIAISCDGGVFCFMFYLFVNL